MNGVYYTIYNNIRDRDAGIKPVSRPNIPTAEQEYDEIKVPGRDGNLYRKKGTLKDIPIEITYNFLSDDPEDWAEDFRSIKRRFLKESTGMLMFSDDPGYYYKVKKIDIGTNERLAKRIGKFQVTFTCEGYMYLTEGAETRNLSDTLYNAFEECKPVYEIAGDGVCTLTVNDTEVTANIGGKLVIDTGLKLCYTALKETANRRLTGYYEDLYLKEGEAVRLRHYWKYALSTTKTICRFIQRKKTRSRQQWLQKSRSSSGLRKAGTAETREAKVLQ